MIPLRIPGSHPNAGVIQRWAQDKEQILNNHGSDIKAMQAVLKTILTNNPDLGKPAK